MGETITRDHVGDDHDGEEKNKNKNTICSKHARVAKCRGGGPGNERNRALCRPRGDDVILVSPTHHRASNFF